MQKYRIGRAGIPLVAFNHILCDLLVIFLGTYLTHIAMYLSEDYWHVPRYFMAVILIGFLVAAIVRDLYHSWSDCHMRSLLILLLKVWTLGYWPAVLYYQLVRTPLSWSFVVSNYLFTGMLLAASYCLVHQLLNKIQSKKVLNVALIGRNEQGIELIKSLKQVNWRTYHIVGFYDEDGTPEQAGLEREGDFTALLRDAKQGKIDQIMIVESINRSPRLVQLITELADTTCTVMFVPDIFHFPLLRACCYSVNNIPMISIYDTPYKGINSVMKRIEDVVLSSIILVLISPILLLITILVKMTSKGPVLFKQDRYGENGKVISVWKFRSMKVLENGVEVKQVTRNDPRLTPIGSLLRKTSLDELPQFFNVLLGDMSIVGPRPHAVVHNEEYRNLIAGYMQRHKVKPGITGWAQINGYRGETDTLDKMAKRVEYDLDYIRNWSVSLDLKIIFLTIFKGFIGKSAY